MNVSSPLQWKDLMSEDRRKIDLCVLILSYNRPTYLKEAVQSVLCQDVLPLSITILDNGSSPDIRNDLREELDHGVLWEGAEKANPSIWNFRRAIRMAGGKYFYMMHDDDRLLPSFLGKMYDFLEAHEDIIAVGCNAELIDGDGKCLGNSLVRKSSKDVRIFDNQMEMALLYSKDFIPFPSVVYRNGFPQKVPLNEENGKVGDAFFLCELASHGKMAYLDQALFQYRIHGGQDSMVFPFDQLRRMDEHLLTLTKSDPKIHSRVLRNVSRFETKQALLSVFVTMSKTRAPRKIIACIEKVRTPYFNPIHIPWIVRNDWRNVKVWLGVFRSR